MKRLARVSIAILFVLSWTASSEVQGAPVGPHCINFNNGSISGFTEQNVILGVNQPGPSGGAGDYYLECDDDPGTSYVIAPPSVLGNYTDHLGDCSAICFDVRLFRDGNPSVVGPPTLVMHPYLILFNSAANLSATFTTVATLQLTELDTTWRHVCAPIRPLLPTGGLPNNQDGTWAISSGNNADWPTLIDNVTEVRLPNFDAGNGSSELAGYDNVCVQNTGGCQSSTNKDITNNTGQPVDNLEIVIAGSFPSIDWHFDGGPTYVASQFAFVPGSTTTLLKWTGITPAVPNGGVFHAGFRVSGPGAIHDIVWTAGDAFAGCATQVNAAIQFPGEGDLPVVVLNNNVATSENCVFPSCPCVPVNLYVGDVSVEWFENEIPLADLNTTSMRTPIRTDSFAIAPVEVPVGTRVPLAFPLVPPATATFGMVRYTVSSNATLNGPGDTTDFIQFGINYFVAEVPAFGGWSVLALLVMLSGSGLYLAWAKRRAETAR